MRNGGELSDLEYLPMKTENIIIRNGGVLSDLEYLPTKKEYTEYLQIADARTSPFLRPFKQNYSRFK